MICGVALLHSQAALKGSGGNASLWPRTVIAKQDTATGRYQTGQRHINCDLGINVNGPHGSLLRSTLPLLLDGFSAASGSRLFLSRSPAMPTPALECEILELQELIADVPTSLPSRSGDSGREGGQSRTDIQLMSCSVHLVNQQLHQLDVCPALTSFSAEFPDWEGRELRTSAIALAILILTFQCRNEHGGFLTGRVVTRKQPRSHPRSSNVDLEKAAMGAINMDAKITVYVALACLVRPITVSCFAITVQLQVLIPLRPLKAA